MTSEVEIKKPSNEVQATERCTVAVMPRDRFSTVEKCIETVFENTPEPFDLLVLLGGASRKLQARLQNAYGSRAKLVFKPEFLNGSQLRNLALEMTQTRLAVFVDSDVFVRPNWLAPLIQCQVETGASMVVPIVLDRLNQIHTAGNDLFLTQINGKTIGSMELRYAHHYVGDSTNIPRRETDFAEMHCHLVIAEDAKNFRIYDERLREHEEMDAGLVLKKAGRKMMCEPQSMVYLYYPDLLNDVDDVRLFIWKWDMGAMKDSIDCFYEKWKIDINHRNHFLNWFARLNQKAGFFSRLYPSKFSIFLDRNIMRLRNFLTKFLGKTVNLATLQGWK